MPSILVLVLKSHRRLGGAGAVRQMAESYLDELANDIVDLAH
jgi:hypothetical protein